MQWVVRSELRLPKPPIDRARKLHQRMGQVNDLIQRGAEQILLPGLLSLSRPHRSPSLVIFASRTKAPTGTAAMQLVEKGQIGLRATDGRPIAGDQGCESMGG